MWKVAACLLVGFGAIAAPSPKAEVEALVRAHLTAVGTDRWQPDELGLADDVVIYTADGSRGRYGSQDNPIHGPGVAFAHEVVLEESIAIKHVDVVVDGDVAWVQADYQLDGKGSAGSPAKSSHDPQHAGGMALRGTYGWQLEAMGYNDLVSDHDLVTMHPRFASDKLPTDPPELAGNRELAKAVAGWIASGFTGHGAHAGTLASGSAPGEIAAGDGVAKLVKSWDGLGLRASTIEVTVLPGGKAGFVHAEVAFPIKGTKRAAPLFLNIGTVREADGWHWAVLAYGAPPMM